MPETNQKIKPAFPGISSSFHKAPEKKQEATSYDELLPKFPAALIKHTLFGYLDDSEGLGTIKELSSHPQFEFIAKTKMLLQHVAYGEYKEVEALISKNPELLLGRDTVTDYSGRIHPNKTALELALGAQDTNVVRENKSIAQDGMVELITKHLTEYLQSIGKSPEAINEELENQFKNQFPEGWEQKEANKLEVDKAALDTMIKAIESASQDHVAAVNKLEDKIFNLTREAKPTGVGIELATITESIRKTKGDEDFNTEFSKLKNYILEHNNDNPKDKFIESDAFNFELLEAIYKFRNHFEPKEPHKTGKHFNLELLVYAAQQYGAKYEAFGNHWNTATNLMHWQKVFGYIERFVPACDAQIIAQGIWLITTENGKKSNRSLKFTFGGGEFFPLVNGSNFEIGYTTAGRARADSGGLPGGALAAQLGCRGGSAWAGAGWRGGAGGLSRLMSSKNINTTAMQYTQQDQQKSHCVIL